MQKLNAFWESNVVACACQADAYAAGCTRNAFVVPAGYGYIFYDAYFLDALDSTTGSTLPADFLMAHEFGHNIQLALGLNFPGKASKAIELQADCLGGYYVGFQAKSGQVTSSEVISTFQFACSIGDPYASPWWAPGAHGVCVERTNALQQGINGYIAGLLPGQACP
jgi:predicted metalloprotease